MTKKEEPVKIKRPWGGYAIIEKKGSYWIKKLFVAKGKQTSLQSHAKREEVWIVLQGKIRATHGTKHSVLSVGEIIKVRCGEKHRLYGVTDAIVLEAAFGAPRERDIVRYADDYGRV